MMINLEQKRVELLIDLLRVRRAQGYCGKTEEEMEDIDSLLGYLCLYGERKGNDGFDSEAQYQIERAKAFVKDAITCLHKVVVEDVEGARKYTLNYRAHLLNTMTTLTELKLGGFSQK